MNAAATSPAKVLVVDDAEGTRLVFANWLRRAGYDVYEANTGTEALEIIARTNVDLVLLDINLPDMSGMDVCDRIKRSRATSAVPVLHVSATAIGADDRSTALNRGADGYLIEPIERDELLATVTSLLRYHEARLTSERLATRLERLHQATLLMNAAPSVTDLLQFACTGLASVFGTTAAVLVSRDGVGHVATASANQLEPVVVTRSPDEILDLASSARLGTVGDLTALRDLFGDADQQAVASPIATPRGELVGAVLLLTGQSSPGDELMLDHFAQALAVALENQRLYSIEHQIALTLQRAMLPQSVPRPPYLDIAVRYLAAGDTVEIGGDFYEAIELDDNITMLAVGDVAGHSLHAATVMAELRHSLRTLASVGVGAADIVTRLSTLLRVTHSGLTATLCIAEVDNRGELRITNAGHIPPIVRSGEEAHLVTDHGPLLGLQTGRRVPTVTMPFPPGSLLVMTTDGLVERRDEGLTMGLDRFTSTVRAHTGDLEGLCDRLLHEVGNGSNTFDDIAIIAARRI